MKRIISILLSFSLAISLAIPAFAVDDEATQAAQALYELGLFSGTGTDVNGNPNFDLDRTPTRHEAVTMLVRLLGKEAEAKNGTWDMPFTDVAEWAKPYIGYAHHNGLASGTSATTFGGNDPVTASQYLTLVLRALGYESGVDFQWNKAWELSDQIGLTNGEYNASTTTFTRGDVAIISHRSLSISDKTQTENKPPIADNGSSIADNLQNTVWIGFLSSEQYLFAVLYAFDDTTYSCVNIVRNPATEDLIANCYDEGNYSIEDGILHLNRTKAYVYEAGAEYTNILDGTKAWDYPIKLDENIMKLGNVAFVRDNPEDEISNRAIYEKIRASILEHIPPEISTDNDYGYLAAADFRKVRRQYSSAVAQCGYALAFTDLNGDRCVLTVVNYKIISNYSIVTLHNLTQNRTIEDPDNYYSKLANRAYGNERIHYWDLSIDVQEHYQEALKAMLSVLQSGKNTGRGTFVNSETLNQ